VFKWLQYLRAIPQLVALVRELLDLVRHAEDLVAGGARGGERKALVLTLLDTAITLGQTLGIPEADKVDRAAVRAAAGPLIDTIVAALNAAGIFKHAGAPASAGS